MVNTKTVFSIPKIVVVVLVCVIYAPTAHASVRLEPPSIDKSLSDYQRTETDAAAAIASKCPAGDNVKTVSVTCLDNFGKYEKTALNSGYKMRCKRSKHWRVCNQTATGISKKHICNFKYVIDKAAAEKCKSTRGSITHQWHFPQTLTALKIVQADIYNELSERRIIQSCGSFLVQNTSCNNGLAIGVQAYNSYQSTGTPSANGYQCIITGIHWWMPGNGDAAVDCVSGEVSVKVGFHPDATKGMHQHYGLPQYCGLETFTGYMTI